MHPDICNNGGNCSNTNGSYICDCVKPWDGENCTYYNTCLTEPCKNGGECFKTGGDNDTSYHCDCKFGFEGKDCTADVDECALNTTSVCLNGNCSNSVGSYNCTCQLGWTGKNCNITEVQQSTVDYPTSTIKPSTTDENHETTMTRKQVTSAQETRKQVTSAQETRKQVTSAQETRKQVTSTEESDGSKHAAKDGESEESKHTGKDGTPIIVGAGVGGVVVVIVVCILGYYQYKR